MAEGIHRGLLQALQQTDPEAKCRQVDALHQAWREGSLARDPDAPLLPLEVPGRPERPQLVDPRDTPKRSLGSPEGRAVMLHAFAHIEFNAINLALDAAYRFRDMPDAFLGDWLRVAAEEARHFRLIRDYLRDLGHDYGHWPAHNGLWEMACKTRHDVLHRMALVPRVMEARGLDVTPGLMQRFAQAGDERAVAILQVIYDEEIGHVAIGNRWYHHCCEQRELPPRETFQALIRDYFGRLRGPFNREARMQAGFEEDELTAMEQSLC